MKKVLFLCTGNSCRSQMAEGWARHTYGDSMEMYSAGTAPHRVDLRAIQVMTEAGVDISSHTSNHVNEYLSIPFDLVITVCDSARESCPVFPGEGKLMESQKVHQTGCMRSVHPGVGVVPGGFNSPGGGGKPSTASQNGSKRFFARLSESIHRPFDDPPALAKSAGSEEEVLNHYRRIRDEIRNFVSSITLGDVC